MANQQTRYQIVPLDADETVYQLGMRYAIELYCKVWGKWDWHRINAFASRLEARVFIAKATGGAHG
jgi:hypothetical protein